MIMAKATATATTRTRCSPPPPLPPSPALPPLLFAPRIMTCTALQSLAKDLFLDFFGVPAMDPTRTRPGVYRRFEFGPAGRRVQVQRTRFPPPHPLSFALSPLLSFSPSPPRCLPNPRCSSKRPLQPRLPRSCSSTRAGSAPHSTSQRSPQQAGGATHPQTILPGPCSARRSGRGWRRRCGGPRSSGSSSRRCSCSTPGMPGSAGHSSRASGAASSASSATCRRPPVPRSSEQRAASSMQRAASSMQRAAEPACCGACRFAALYWRTPFAQHSGGADARSRGRSARIRARQTGWWCFRATATWVGCIASRRAPPAERRSHRRTTSPRWVLVKGTRRFQLVRRDGRDASTLYGREGAGGGGCCSRAAAPFLCLSPMHPSRLPVRERVCQTQGLMAPRDNGSKTAVTTRFR